MVLEAQGIHCEYVRKSDSPRILEMSDTQIGALVTQLVSQGLQVYRVASERKSLEEAFLESVETPQNHIPQNHVAQSCVEPSGRKQRVTR